MLTHALSLIFSEQLSKRGVIVMGRVRIVHCARQAASIRFELSVYGKTNERRPPTDHPRQIVNCGFSRTGSLRNGAIIAANTTPVANPPTCAQNATPVLCAVGTLSAIVP